MTSLDAIFHPSVTFYLLHLHIFIIHLNNINNNNNSSCIMPVKKLLWYCTGCFCSSNKVKIRTHSETSEQVFYIRVKFVYFEHTAQSYFNKIYKVSGRRRGGKQGELSVWRFLSLTMLLVIKGEEEKLLKNLSVCVFLRKC